MSSPAFQVASLVNPPSYPNALVWSDDNFIAVANGDIVTILNPDNVQGPRGVITITAGKPFPVGVIDRDDLVSGCLLPTCLARDRQPIVRSLSWSPVGYTPGNGCLLAVCSNEGRVKVYREPLCEFQAEWIEVMDLSDLLHGYFAQTNYAESETLNLAVTNDLADGTLPEDSDATDNTKATSRKENKRKRVDNVNSRKSANTQKSDPTYNPLQIVSVTKAKTLNKRKLNVHADILTAQQYASRYSMMASLVVAWSPVLQFPANDPDNPCESFCLLAVGTKSGTISIWRFNKSSYYSIEQRNDPIPMALVGFVHAHSAWVTAMSWGLLASDSSPQVLLASGCSDGSAKIWLAHIHDFKRSSEANQTPFTALSEISVAVNAPVSTISLCIPAQSPQQFLVAVGRGSGSIEVWAFDRTTKSPKKVGSCNAHVHTITGLTWAFDGRCLYSCSQDNSIYGWIHHKGGLFKASIPPNSLGTRSSSELPSVTDSCYGVAVSPANLALAVARRFDVGQLDNMYQKRTQRADVEFFWIGGQEFNMSQRFNLNRDIDPCPGFTKEELVGWGSKLIWSLNKYESCDKQLVVWDILVAVLAFKQCAPEFIKLVILRWLVSLVKPIVDSSTNDILLDLPHYMSQFSSRRLQLLNILCRRVMLSSGCKDAKISTGLPEAGESNDMEVEKWLNVLSESEKELRERLVGLSLSTVLSHLSRPASKIEPGLWKPVGIAQMMKWVSQNRSQVHHKLNLLTTEVRGHAARLHNVYDYVTEEHCCYCYAPVPFESPEVALCEGAQCGVGEAPQQHKLSRCTVSMQVCPLKPLWFCICCQNRASNLPPNHLHKMVNRPLDFVSYIKSAGNLLPNPSCPFCGISMQRRQPDFLLSKSPV